MKVRMRTTAAGPTGTLSQGEVVEVPHALGEMLVEGGYAEFVSGGTAVEEEIRRETATAEPAEDTSMPRARRRRGG